MKGKEISDYPENPNIIWKDEKRTFHYKIIKIGVYPQEPTLCHTQKPYSCPIPHDYIIQTTWNRNKCTVQCSINYDINDKPTYIVAFNDNFSDQVVSNRSSSDAATLFHKKVNPESNTRTSGVLLFGLHLKSVQQHRINKKSKKRILKPVNEVSHSTLTKRAKNVTKQIFDDFKNISENHYNPIDQPLLEEVQFSVKDYKFKVKIGDENMEMKKHKNEAIVMAIDKGPISRDAYRNLATIEDELPREWIIAEQRTQINKQMNDKVKITTVEMPQYINTDSAENPDIIDSEIIDEITTSIGKGGQRSIKDILNFIVPDLVRKNVLDPEQKVINLRISGDGRNVGKKIKHVMITFAILDDIDNIHNPNYHHTVVLYPGSENYNSLDISTALFRNELRELTEVGMNIDGINWMFNLYFSSDWKFLTICLGFNSANSLFFCPWCTISKKEVADIYKEWKISKQIEHLDTCRGHNSIPLFDMISLDHWIPDELHIMLRITDRLWTLVLHEIKEAGFFNDIAREIIVKEMSKIKVHFCFWQEKEHQTWSYTSLMGQDKLKVLRFFDLSKILSPTRASAIRMLWDGFYDLYVALRNPNTDSKVFKNNARMWLKMFLTPSTGSPNSNNFVQGLYRPNDLTPYIHVLVFHIHELMEKHKKWGLKAFSCAAVENKNHQQISQFFRKTLKDGGKGLNRKSAIIQILEFENRKLYYINNPQVTSKRIKLQI